MLRPFPSQTHRFARLSSRFALLIAIVIAVASWPGLCRAQTFRDDLYVPNGPVTCSVEYEGKLYIGGGFTRVAPPTGGAAPVDSATGLVSWFPKVRGVVYAIAADGSGGVYLGGQFTSVGGAPITNLVHVLADHSIAPWNPAPNSDVKALTVSGGTLYIGGQFTTLGGLPRNHIGAIEISSGNVTSWDPNANGNVRTLVVSGTTVYAGGDFTSIGGQTRGFIAALDATTNTSNATGWDPNANSAVLALAVSGNTVYAGGDFTNIGGQTRNFVAALDATTNTNDATSWNPGADGEIDAIVVTDRQIEDVIYAGGRLNFMAVSSSGLEYPCPTMLGQVTALAVSGDLIYVGRSFLNDDLDNERHHIAAFPLYGIYPTDWDPSADGPVHALAAGGSTVWVGGEFAGIGGVTRNYLAALDLATGSVTPWNPDIGNEPVGALAVGGRSIYVANQGFIAAVDTAGTVGFVVTGVGGVSALAMSNGKIYVGGSFTAIGVQPRNHLLALDAFTGALTPWDPNANGAVNALVVSDGKVYVGGSFTAVGGQSRNHIAALDPAIDTNNATAWDPNANDDVSALHVIPYSSGSATIYAGGAFTSIGGQSRNRIAALGTYNNTNNATAWDPNSNGPVLELTADEGNIYAGGSFSSIGGQPRAHLAAIDPNSGIPRSWHPLLGGSVYSLTVSVGTVYAGGQTPTTSGVSAAPILQILPQGFVTEGNLGTSTANFLVKLSPSQPGVVTVDYTTSDGAATAGTDYVATSGTLTFQPGETLEPIPVTVNGDLAAEDEEDFHMTISDSSGADIYSSAVGQMDILDDDSVRQVLPNAYVTDGMVNAVAVSGGTTYIGGAFTRVGPATGYGVPVDIATGQPTWLPKVNGSVNAVASDGAGGWYLGGSFTQRSEERRVGKEWSAGVSV